MQDDDARPSYGELAAICAAGGMHVTAELAFSTVAARLFNVSAAILFVTYVTWRAIRNREVLQIWGMHSQNFWPALKLQLVFAIPAMAVLAAWGSYYGRFPPPMTFCLILLLYPIWGIAQQFALQNFLARNLRDLVPHPFLRATVAATLFAAAHVPLMPVVVLTLVVGFVHGALGAMAFYFVLGKDPGAQVWKYVFG